MRPTDRRSDTHRKWIGMGRGAVNSEIIFSSHHQKVSRVTVPAPGEEAKFDFDLSIAWIGDD